MSGPIHDYEADSALSMDSEPMKACVKEVAAEITMIMGRLAAQLAQEQKGAFSLGALLHALELAALTTITLCMHRHRESIQGAIDLWADDIRKMRAPEEAEIELATKERFSDWLEAGFKRLERERAERAIGAALSLLRNQPKEGDTVN
jgi:hypothetical protein